MIRAPRHFVRLGTRLPAILVLAACIGQLPDAALAQVSPKVAGRLSECVGRPGQEPVLCKGVPNAGIYLTDSLRSDDKTRTWRTVTDEEGDFTFEFDTLLARHCYHLGLTKFGGRLLYDSVRVDGKVLQLANRSLETARDSSAGCVPVGDRKAAGLEIVVYSNRGVAAVAVVATQILPPPDPRVEGWRLGLGGGATSLFAGGMSFVTPAVTVFGAKDGRWYVTVLGGWRPLPSAGQDPLYPSQLSAPRPQFGARAQGMAAINASLFPSRIRRSLVSDDTSLVTVPGWWGIAVGVQGAWETVRGSDEYLERAYGFAVGPRFRLNPLGRFDVALGVDLMIANLSEFGQPDSRWRFGVGPTVTVGYFLR